MYDGGFAPALGQTVQDFLNECWRDLEKASHKRESESAKADPKAHKLSRVMEGQHGMNYHWFPAGKDGRGRSVYLCWSLHRNVAGYFLGWREVHAKKTVKRDQWIARKAKCRAKGVAERRAEAFRKRQSLAKQPQST